MRFLKLRQWQQEQQALEVLSSLSYRNGEISSYLQAITRGVSQLVNVDWSVVTLCQNGFEKVLASSIDMGDGAEETFLVHGSVTGTVVETGRTLVVEDIRTCKEYGKTPEGYRSYLGVPLRPSHGEVIGTICSFHRKPRKFSLQEVRIAEMFAERAATAIDNYHLYLQECRFNELLSAEVAKRTEELRQAQIRLVEQERLAAIGEFASGIVHEIRNPLTTMLMGLNYFKRIDLPETGRERLDLALEEGDRLQRLLREILLYAKPQRLQLTEIEINEFIKSVWDSLCSMPEAKGRKIEFYPSLNVAIKGDKDKLKQVLINIVRNACEAVSEGETVKCFVENNAYYDKVCILVHNCGEPIPPEVLSKLGEPFFSTKASGTGLGLAITKRIVEAHGGEFSINSSAEEGTTVSVRLPNLSSKFEV